MDDGGLEYLFGWCVRGEGGGLTFRGEWGFDRAGERLVFERFVDEVMARWKDDPGMHVYHFAPYEPSALKRLMGRYATREEEVDQMLRGKRLVDLHAITKQGVRASIEGYGLKDLEPVIGFEREVDLREAGLARHRLECALEFFAPEQIEPTDLTIVEGYNREDCEATAALRDWLEERRTESIELGNEVPRPPLEDGEPSDDISESLARVQVVYDKLVDDLPEDRDTWGEDERARWMLAQMLDYHRREMNCAHWDFFATHDLDFEDLLQERKAIAGLEFIGEVDGGTVKCPVHRYRFVAQEAAFSEENRLYEVGVIEKNVGTVHAIDPAADTIDIKKTGLARDIHPAAVMVDGRIKPWVKADSLLELARSVSEHGTDGDGPFRAGRDLLLKRLPRRNVDHDEALRRTDEELLETAVRLAGELDHGLLPIQGPPGSGKTYIGARMIVDLARKGKRIGVTAVSHKVIRNLLNEVLAAAGEQGTLLIATHKIGSNSGSLDDGSVVEVTGNDDAALAVAAQQIVGGTAWLWSRDDMQEKLDYLFVDEAGQMALAAVLAVSRAAHNVVLLGDPQQLEQPQRAVHPDGTEVAALVHVLDGRNVIAPDKGLFFDETWRLHPAICEFTSELYYEGELHSRPGLEQQTLGGPTKFASSGLYVQLVEHEGCQSSSTREVRAVQEIVHDLLQDGVTFTDREGATRTLSPNDILILAPYNAQLAALKRQLPDLRIGTVDKFQGQEAPVVIYSMAASSIEDAPRGMEFLFNPNRLNVATSRAQAACILVANPRLFAAECRTPDQMRWANGLCRYRELAEVL